MIAKGEDYIIRPLEPDDKYQLLKWQEYSDPIFYGYNYSDMTESELNYWYNSKQFPFRSRYFAVINNEKEMFAYIGMKEINRFTRSSKLGIVMDAKYVSKGYGYMIMNDFLDYYFNQLAMKRMILEVNAWNKRAIRLYESLGFKYYSFTSEKFENQSIDLDSSKYDDVREFFEERSSGLYNKILKMSISRDEYIGR